MNYWIFKCNPDKYRIDDRLKDPENKITWLVTRYRDKIKVDDIAFIWRTGNKRGIVGAIKIVEKPFWRKELDTELPYCIDLDNSLRMRVVADIFSRGPFLSQEYIQSVSKLQDLSIFRGFKQATNYKITENEGRLILDIMKIKSNSMNRKNNKC